MKISLSMFRSFILMLVLPVIGVVEVFRNINLKNQKWGIILISLFSACFVINIPPFQDLYRRYLETYSTYTAFTSINYAIYGKVDIIFYVISLYFKKLGIPFFYISSLAVFSSVYNHLQAVRLVIKNKSYEPESVKRIYLAYYFFINIMLIALGIRMGWAVSFMILALTQGSFNEGSKLKVYILMVISILIHFSMLLVAVVFIASKFINIKKGFVPFLIITSLFLGKLVVPIILNSFGLGGISEYAINGYVDNKTFANSSGNSNEIIVYTYYYSLATIIIITQLFNNKHGNLNLNKFINIYVVSVFLLSSFYVAFNRYFIETGMFIYIIGLISVGDKIINSKKYIIILMATFNMIFVNIFLERRPLDMGGMWKGLITPIPISLMRSEDDFEQQLKYVDEDGNWIGHNIK